MTGPRETLTVKQILEWADKHYDRTGKWPNSRTGTIHDEPRRTWESVQTALSKGTCGLGGGSSLFRVLQKHRDARDPRIVMPNLTLSQILKWVDSHRAVTGQWPWRDCGTVIDSPSITWATIDNRMEKGDFGLPKPTTLARWLRDVRGVWDGGKPRLTEKLVLRWAHEHFDRTGRWPVTMSGDVVNHAGENWAAVDVALRNKRRGFPYRTSLSRLLQSKVGSAYTQHIGGPRKKTTLGRTVRRIRVRAGVA